MPINITILNGRPRLKSLLAFLLCFAVGGFSSLAMSPTNLWPLLFVGISIVYYLVANARTHKGAFFYGWFFGFGYFLFGLSWIGNALLVDGNPYAWAWPLAVSGLPFILSLFPALACLIAHRFVRISTLSGFFAFSALLFLSELARGYVFTGFPWNLYGYTWVEMLPIVQSVSFGSIYGLTWLTILWSSSFGFIALNDASKQHKAIVTVFCAISFALCFSYGSLRLKNTQIEYHEDIQIRIVQPNIPQSEKWDRRKMTQNYFKHIKLSLPTLTDPELETTKATYIIWPETALSYWYTSDKTSMNILSDALRDSYQNPAYVFTGVLERDAEQDTYSNSLIVINKDGDISNLYNKHHLVPFGEYIPFQEWIPLQTVTSFSGFISGDGPKVYQTEEGLSYTPLICYEAIFPGLTPHQEGTRPDFIINVTNDGWYGFSAGPHQHLTQTRFRAVEEGMPVIRAANTGISALIDPLGRILHRDELFTEASSSHIVPKKIVGFDGQTKRVIILLFLLSIVISFVGYIRKRLH